MGLLESIIYNFYKSSIGFFATWQELWMLVHGKLTGGVLGGFGCTNWKIDRVDQNRLESRSMEISPWGLVVFSCLDCDVREVS